MWSLYNFEIGSGEGGMNVHYPSIFYEIENDEYIVNVFLSTYLEKYQKFGNLSQIIFILDLFQFRLDAWYHYRRQHFLHFKQLKHLSTTP